MDISIIFKWREYVSENRQELCKLYSGNGLCVGCLLNLMKRNEFRHGNGHGFHLWFFKFVNLVQIRSDSGGE